MANGNILSDVGAPETDWTGRQFGKPSVNVPQSLQSQEFGFGMPSVERTFETDPAGLWRTARMRALGAQAALPQFARTAMQGFTPAYGGYLRTGGTGTFGDYLRSQQAGGVPAAQAGWGDVMAASRGLSPYATQDQSLTPEQFRLQALFDPAVAKESARANALAMAGSLMGGGRGYGAALRQRALGNLYDLYATRAAGEGRGVGGFLGYLGQRLGQTATPAQAAAATQGITTPVTAEQRFVDPTITSQNEAALNAALTGTDTGVTQTVTPPPITTPPVTATPWNQEQGLANALGRAGRTNEYIPRETPPPLETLPLPTTEPTWGTPPVLEPGLEAALGGSTIGGTNIPMTPGVAGDTTVFNQPTTPFMNMQNQVPVPTPGTFTTPTEGVMSPADQAFFGQTANLPAPQLTSPIPVPLSPGVAGDVKAIQAAAARPTTRTIGGSNIPMTPGIAEEGDAGFFNQLRNVPEFREQFYTDTIKTPGIPATPTQESDVIDTMLQMSATDPVNMIAPPDPAFSGMRPAEKAAAQEAGVIDRMLQMNAVQRANELRGRPDDTPWGRLGITEEEWNRRRNETFNRFSNLGITF